MDNNKDLNNIINQAITDANYVRDNSSPTKNISNVIIKWLIYTCFMFIILFIMNMINNIYNSNLFSIIIRITTILLNIISVVIYYRLISKCKSSVKEIDFLKLYGIIPGLLAFTYCIKIISYYTHANILIQLIDSLSLDLVILIMSSIILKYYINDKKIDKFILYNCVIFIISLIIWGISVSINSSPVIMTDIKNIMNFLRTNGLFIIMHYILLLNCIKKRKDNPIENIS